MMITAIKELLVKLTKDLEMRSRSTLEKMTVNVEDADALKYAIKNRRIARLSWCESQECAEKIKERSGGEVRGYRIDVEEKPESKCIVCGRRAVKVVYVAKAY
jgi:prolyl-tRNA synthetase